MNTETLTPEIIAGFIPNVLTEVEGETPLAQKLEPFIASAKVWIEREYLGSEDFLDEQHNELALEIIVTKALADALPALDVVLTPTGLAVVSTDTLAPASKERVTRLANSLRDRVDKLIPALLEFCRSYEQWLLSERGEYFSTTFLTSPDDCSGLSSGARLSYSEARLRAVVVEGELAEYYLGKSFMDALRKDYCARTITRSHPLVSIVLSSILTLISSQLENVVDRNRLWHVANPILNQLKYFPEYYLLWEEEMGDLFNSSGFVNDVKGGFFF